MKKNLPTVLPPMLVLQITRDVLTIARINGRRDPNRALLALREIAILIDRIDNGVRPLLTGNCKLPKPSTN